MRATAKLVPGTLRNEVLVRDSFLLHTDEPEAIGGEDTAQTPHELLAAALAACISTTIAIYARTKDWELGDVLVEVEYDKDVTPRRFRIDIRLDGDYDAGQIARLETVAASCPVRRSLEAGFAIEEHVHASVLV
ncbi:MAG TPA: OsmC family protein [Gaiellaceae bacterium]|nr:OsmC family protein [Gaiellaceae bacterium]